ncbi:MAG: hypothetical protein HC845_15915, partial [Akkermansiaceae bacterium]|nr:hypothetical protein [Akkermansiaceae bacterium]
AGTKKSNVDLIAPTGTIDAGDAGIQASGNISISAPRVVGADNISSGGKSSGVPAAAPSTPSIGAVTAATNANAATSSTPNNTTNANQKSTEVPKLDDALSLITVEVIGYGGGGDEEEEEEDKEKQESEVAP